MVMLITSAMIDFARAGRERREMIRHRLLVGLITASIAVTVIAQVRSIASVGIFTRPPRAWDARCPANLQFVATINANRWPVMVSYRWERSDGATMPTRRVDVRSAHQRVSDNWRLGRHGDRLTVWERLHVVAPTNVSSADARVNVICR
jgi:hypothetical protein